MCGIDGLRGQRRINFVIEIRGQETALLLAQLIEMDNGDALVAQFAAELFAPMLLSDGSHVHDSAPDFSELPGRAHPVIARGLAAAAVEAEHVGHTDHEKLIQVRVENSQELQLLQERSLVVKGALQHPSVEFQPVELTVEEQRRAVKILNLFRGAAFKPCRVPCFAFLDLRRACFSFFPFLHTSLLAL